jgi:hypothetical protein
MIVEPAEQIIPDSKANIASVIIFVLSFLTYGSAYGTLWGFNNVFFEFRHFLTSYLTLIMTLSGGMILHEFLHGFTWAQFCHGGLRSIRYGIKWYALAPYAHCIEPLPIRGYRLGGRMPGLVLGIVPALFGIIVGNGWALMTGIFFTSGAAGDLMIIWKLRN